MHLLLKYVLKCGHINNALLGILGTRAKKKVQGGALLKLPNYIFSYLFYSHIVKDLIYLSIIKEYYK